MVFTQGLPLVAFISFTMVQEDDVWTDGERDTSLMTRQNNPKIPCLGFTSSESEAVFSSAESVQVDNYSLTAPPTAEQRKDQWWKKES